MGPCASGYVLTMSTDAIVMLKADHKEIKKVFRDFENAGEDATARKGQLVTKMIELLTVTPTSRTR
jgi:hypothetical protein